jgi:subtilisin family serine protease
MTSNPAQPAVRHLFRAAFLVGALLVGAAVHPKPAQADPSAAGEILVRLQSTGALGPLLTKHGLGLASQFGARPIYRLKVVGTTSVQDKINALLAEPSVLIAEPNFDHSSPEARKNNAWAIGTESAYQAQWAPAAIHLTQAHALSKGAGMRVAVLDTGVDATHAALAGRLLAGFDFVDGDTDPSEVVSTSASTSYGHGTHVAGLVALVAPGARIMPLRVLDAQGVGNAWVLAEAMLYAVDPDRNPATDDGAHVMNLSLGSFSRTQLLDTLAQLTACAIPAKVVKPIDDFTDPGYNDDKARCANHGGAVIVAAAGNDGSDKVREYPAAEGAYGLISVGASTAAGGLAAFSNSGSWVQIAAPGEGITSAIPGGGYATWSGTSMAAPLVAGTAALVRQANPGMLPVDVVRRLNKTSANLCGTSLRQVDAAAALTGAVPANPTCP